MLTFVYRPFHYNEQFPGKNEFSHDKYLKIVIASGCDFLASLTFCFVIVLVKRVCIKIKPSQMKHDNDREPSIAEIAFFIQYNGIL